MHGGSFLAGSVDGSCTERAPAHWERPVRRLWPFGEVVRRRVGGEREGDRERGPLAGHGRNRGGAAVRLGDRGDDRKAEADAAARPRSRGVGAVEALEDVLRCSSSRPGPESARRSPPCRSAASRRPKPASRAVCGRGRSRAGCRRSGGGASRSPTTTALSAWSSIAPFRIDGLRGLDRLADDLVEPNGLALERPAVVEAARSRRSSTRTLMRSDSRLIPLIERSRSSGRSAAPRSYSSAYARTAESGVRSSCEASATKRRSFRSDASCARNDASIRAEHDVQREAEAAHLGSLSARSTRGRGRRRRSRMRCRRSPRAGAGPAARATGRAR